MEELKYEQQRDPGPASIKWMAALGLKEGEWFHASKPALKAGMRPTFELKARVWCCGMLHTQSYQGECAMTTFRKKTIPLSPAGIAKKLRDEALEFYAGAGKVLTKAQEKALDVSRQHVRRALVELEREGLAERRTADGLPLRDLSPDELKRLPIGRIRLYFFVRPLPSRTVPDVAINGYVSFAFLSPRESRVLNKLLQRFELQPDPYVAGEGYVQETVKVAIAGYVGSRTVALQDYRKAEDVAAQTLKKALDVAVSSERIVRNPVSNPTVRREALAPAREAPPVSGVHVRKAPATSLPPSSQVLEVILDSPSSSSAFSPVEHTHLANGEKAEEEEGRSPYQILKAEYPAEHFDEPKTKPSFEKKTEAQQRHILERLHVYLDCPRWKDADGRWIPFSSKWLETYDLDPPAVMRRKSNGSATRDALEAFMAGEG